MQQSWHYMMYYACICLERPKTSQNTVLWIGSVLPELQTRHFLSTYQHCQLTVFGAKVMRFVNCFHVMNKTPCILNKLAEVVSLLTCIQEVPSVTDPLV